MTFRYIFLYMYICGGADLPEPGDTAPSWCSTPPECKTEPFEHNAVSLPEIHIQ